MDVQAMQSMDWLFKKERIYLLAQFWQQVKKNKIFFNFFFNLNCIKHFFKDPGGKKIIL